MVWCEKRWLLSIMTAVVLAVTMLFSPATVLAAGEGVNGQSEGQSYGISYQFTNSDGQAVDAWTNEDGYVYRIVNSDGTEESPNMVAKIYGNTKATSGTKTLDIPENITVGENSYPVVSVAIDPRYPVSDEVYDGVETINLPKTLQRHHFLRFFGNLQGVYIAEGNTRFFNRNDGEDDGVLYGYFGKNNSFIGVDFFPRGRSDKTWKMWDQLTWTYEFYKGCPLEEITIPRAQDYWFYPKFFRKLNKLKAVYAPEVDESTLTGDYQCYYSEDGILFQKDVEENYSYKKLVFYPPAKEAVEYTVPEDIKGIYEGAFLKQQNLQKLTLPNNNVHCYPWAFSKCRSLKTVELLSSELRSYKSWKSFKSLRTCIRKNQATVLHPEGPPIFDEFLLYLRGERELNWWTKNAYAAGDGQYPCGGNINISAQAHHGEATILYSDSIDGEYTEEAPTETGTYFAKAMIPRTEEYIGIISEPVQFQIVEPETDPESGKYINNIEVRTYNFIARYGNEYTINVEPTYGTPAFLYRPIDGDDTSWTNEKPVNAGFYYFKAVVDETDEYLGAEYDSSQTGNQLVIMPRGFSIWVKCEDIEEGEAPDPQYGIESPEGLDLDISNANFKYYERQTREDGSLVWVETEGIPTEQGKYKVVVTVESPDSNYECDGGYAKFKIIRHVHALTKTEAAAATCTEDGNTEYYTCDTCKKLFADAEGTEEITAADTVVKATGHKLAKTEAKEATCTEDGNIEYYTCETCKKLFSDKEGTEEISAADTVVKAAGHKLAKTEAKEATCTEAGNIEYYTCETCEKLFSDKQGTEEITAADTVVKAAGHELIKTEAKAATCTEDGNIEYYSCETCKKLFSDKEGTEEITAADTVVKAAGHKLTKAEAKAATCTEDGNIEYYSCETCEKLFSDKEGTEEITAADTVVKAAGHKLTKTEAKAATCTEAGNIEYYTCETCKKLFSDKEGTEEITAADTVVKAAGHKLTKTEAKEATCTEDGNIEYYICNKCDKLFSDADASNAIEEKDTILPAAGHDWEAKSSVDKAATCTEEGEQSIHCKNCSERKGVETIPATGHDWGDWEVTKEATEDGEGLEVRVCKNDPSHTEQRKIDKLPKKPSRYLDASDRFWFSNASNHFGYDDYYISENDLQKLFNNVRQLYSKYPDFAQSTINRIRDEQRKTWEGSCYGMAAVTILDKQNAIGFNENFDPPAANMNEVHSPSENEAVKSAINYYFLGQNIPYVRTKNSERYNISNDNWSDGLKKLVSMSQNGEPILFSYFWTDSVNGWMIGHAIVIEGYEKAENGDHHIIAYDNRLPSKDMIIEVSSDFSTCVVNGNEYATSIEYTQNMSAFDAIDIDGPDNKYQNDSNDMTSNESGETAPKPEGANLTVNAKGKVTIQNAEGQKLVIEEGQCSGNIDVLDRSMIVTSTETGEDASELVLTVADSKAFTFESDQKEMTASVQNEDMYGSVETEGAEKVTISQKDGVSAEGKAYSYDMTLAVNNSSLDMVAITGESEENTNVKVVEDGIEATGVDTNAGTVTVFSNDTNTDTYSYGNGYSSIMIAPSDTEQSGQIDIMGSSHNDGNYDVTIGGSSDKTVISKAVIKVSDQAYTGGLVTPKIDVELGTSKLQEGKDYKVFFENNLDVGTASVYIIGTGDYIGSASATFEIIKAKNPMKITQKTIKVKASKLKKKKLTVSPLKVTGAQGDKAFEAINWNVKAKKALKLNQTTGKIQIKKGTKKSTFKVQVQVTAMGNKSYEAGSEIVTVSIRVK